MTRLTIPDLTIHPTVDTLPNGIKLIVQPESISNSVTVLGHIKNNADLETPQGQEGVSSVLDELFPYGTHTLDRIAFQKALDDIGADESAGADFSLNVLSDHFERGMELLADNELHPALPENAFKVVQQQTAGALAGQLQSPDYLTSRALDSALYPKDDPELREATPATVKSLVLAERDGLLRACIPSGSDDHRGDRERDAESRPRPRWRNISESGKRPGHLRKPISRRCLQMCRRLRRCRTRAACR